MVNKAALMCLPWRQRDWRSKRIPLCPAATAAAVKPRLAAPKLRIELQQTRGRIALEIAWFGAQATLERARYALLERTGGLLAALR